MSSLLVVSALPAETATLRHALGATAVPGGASVAGCAGLPGGAVRSGEARLPGGAVRSGEARLPGGALLAALLSLTDGLWQARVNDISLHVAATGAGTTRAAAGTAALVAALQPSAILGIGIGGACEHVPTVSLGDVVIANRVAQYDQDATALRYPAGALGRTASPWMETEIHPWLRVWQGSDAHDDDDALKGQTVHEGGIATGNTFITAERLRSAPASWQAILGQSVICDMESAAWVAVASRLSTQISVVRLVSDIVVSGQRLPFQEACSRLGTTALDLLTACRLTPVGAIVCE